MENICLTAIDPTKYMTFGMSYKVPLLHGLLDSEQIRDVMSSPTFDRDSFDREYNSIWSGSLKGAAFDYKVMQSARKIIRAELKARKVDENSEFYVICADMAKDGKANTAVVVLKIAIGDTHFVYKQVNAFQIDDNDYMKVANKLKKAVITYNARMLIYDAAGINKPVPNQLTHSSWGYIKNMLTGKSLILG